MSKFLSFIIVPHDNSRTRNYRISYSLLYTMGILVVLLIVTFIVFVTTYGRMIVQAHEFRSLENENQLLRQRNAEIDSLRTELVRLQTMGIQIKNMLGVNLSQQDSILVANLSPLANSPVKDGDEQVAEALRAEQQMMLKAIPSLWPVKGYVTREFFTTGGEKSPNYHPGMDIAAKRNTAIRSAADGVVVTSGWDDTYGYVVVVDHGFGLTTLYGHNARNLSKVGDRVTRGQTVAFIGSTGKSTAPHLHFEVKKNGVAVDPRNYLLN